MSDSCIHHGDNPDRACPYCKIVEQSARLEKFYQWFGKSMSREDVDKMLEKLPCE